jgi:hypothetical protein
MNYKLERSRNNQLLQFLGRIILVFTTGFVKLFFFCYFFTLNKILHLFDDANS